MALATAILAVTAATALAGYDRYGAGNYYGAKSVPARYLHHTTGNQVDNGSCEGNGTHCGTQVCACALDANNRRYGSRNCANDQAYHGYSRQFLRGVFDKYACCGVYIYGTFYF